MPEQTHRYQRNIKVIASLFFCSALLFSNRSEANNQIPNLYGVTANNGWYGMACPNVNGGEIPAVAFATQDPMLAQNRGYNCTVTIVGTVYFPTPGHYSIVTYVNENAMGLRGPYSGSAELKSGKQTEFDTVTPLNKLKLAGVDALTPIHLPTTLTHGWTCFVLRNTDTNLEYSLPAAEGACTDVPPLPPTPPPAPTFCTINNSSDLNVSLGSVDRALIGTSPGNGTLQNKQIPVSCTGGTVDVNMQLAYTPLTVNGKEVVKSSSNGLGVSIIYNSEVLAPTDIVPVSFLEGSNTLDLAFEIVRDPAVSIGEVPTGEFTASATLIMTQQ
ncbi:type 1 fimbria pilin [Buttiauxella sp. BIGb0471]|uniref:fimbrial protein n=1 Tax=Buttiauxella sp. BIGb0471 TaxID=2940597 RepID=UPI0021686441|nr:fimbrial protein [Buttiauxella sp. BIGb0471]MCS3601923.1 type 1 fimbria pilin [Buttiauxella sp. BIGb0471]